MANANSFADVINRQNSGQPITISSSTTLHQSFLLSGSPAVLTVPNPMASIDAGEFFPGLAASAKPFILRAAGYSIGGEKFQVDIVNSATALTPVIASTGLYNNGLTADNWLLEVECMWDPTSLNLRGIYYGWAGTSAITQASLLGAPAPASLAALQFNVAVTIATANANAQIVMTEFAGEFI